MEIQSWGYCAREKCPASLVYFAHYSVEHFYLLIRQSHGPDTCLSGKQRLRDEKKKVVDG